MTAESDQTRYARLTGWREEFGNRFGSALRLPVVRSPYSVCAQLDSGGSVLDVGAGVGKSLAQHLDGTDSRYYSLDTDPDGEFDFASIEAVPETERFDLIVLNQVLEHLSTDDAEGMLLQAGGRLAEGGSIVASTPNVQHPVRYWGDATHVTPWPADDLYGLFRCARLTVDGVVRSNKFRLTWNPLMRLVIWSICRHFRIDWCDTIIIYGRREATDVE